jgi:NAD(P)-dependent dehydrogenase (short-subunit alcohol dehydrogenase family)
MKGLRFLLAGGSGGLGRVTAEALAREGAELVISYRQNRQRAEELSSLGQIVQADITLSEDREQLLRSAGPIDGLVVFSGNPARVGDPAQMPAQMELSHATNYMGPLLLARAAAEGMKERNLPGSIVLFSTMQGIGIFPGSTAYAGAKAALIHGAKILAKELRAPSNIRVNVISPGIMHAGMAETSIASGKYQRFLDEGIIPRFGRATDIARAVRFLLEPDSYITGQVLQVDGGIVL